MRRAIRETVDTLEGFALILGGFVLTLLPFGLVLLLTGDVDQAEGTIGIVLLAVFAVAVIGGFVAWLLRD